MAKIALHVVIKHLRSALGLTQEQMARRMGTVTRTIARWESESEAVDSLPLEVVMHLRHLAIEADDAIVAGFFDERAWQIISSPDATKWAEITYRFLPGNQREIDVVGELLRRMREDDPAIKPVLKQMDTLVKQHAAEEELKRQREAARVRGPELTRGEIAELLAKHPAIAKKRKTI